MSDTKSTKKSKLISSAKLTRKNKIILSLLVGAIVFALLFLGLYISDPNKGEESALDKAKRESGYTERDFTVNPSDTVGSESVWLEQSEMEIESNKSNVNDLQKEINSLQEQIADIKQFSNIPDKGTAARVGATARMPPPPPQTSGDFTSSTVVQPPRQPPVVQQPPVIQQQPLLPPPPQSTNTNTQSESLNDNNGNSQLTASPKRQITHINVSGGGAANTNEQSNSKKSNASSSGTSNQVKKNVSNYVPSGTFSKAVLLSGVDAPTGGLASSNPVPVLLRIKDKGTLANYFKSDLKECTAIGAAAGDISSERVNIRLESITCVLTDGSIIEKPIQGYMSGEDGKAGFRGKLISKQGSLIAKSAMAGIAGGLGSAVTEQYKNISTSPLGQVTSIDPNKAIQSGLSQGFGNAMEKVADFYIQRANETYPIIELASARVGDIVLTQGVDFGVDHLGKKRNK